MYVYDMFTCTFSYLCITRRYTVFVVIFVDSTCSELSKTVLGSKNYQVLKSLNAFTNTIPDTIPTDTWIKIFVKIET